MFSLDPLAYRPLAAALLTLSLFLIAATGSADSMPETTPLIISEVLPNAGMGADDYRHEWVEVHNLSDHPVRLEGWSIEDDLISSELPSVTLLAGEFAVIVGRASLLAAAPGTKLLILPTARIGSGLRNDGDRVSLIDPGGITRDVISWGDERRPYHFDAPEANVSIIRDQRGLQSRAVAPTPFLADPRGHAAPRSGSAQQQPPNSIVRMTAAMIAPDADDAAGEWVVIHNISDERVVTAGWTLSTPMSRIAIPARAIRAGESMLIASSVDRRGKPLPIDFSTVADAIAALRDPNGRIASGLARLGGHLILRDSEQHWLATASWGSDTRFHELPAPQTGEALQFRQADRSVRPAPDGRATTPELRILSLSLSASGFEASLISDAATPLDLAEWSLSIDGASHQLPDLVLSPAATIDIAGEQVAESSFRLARTDGSRSINVPLPPVTGAAMDAVEINRPLDPELPPHQSTGSESDPPIWISEVYPAAGMGREDAAHEWFELANGSDEAIRLDGWTIADNHSSDELDGIIIQAGAVIVIAASDRGLAPETALIADGRIGNGLANKQDELVLYDPAGRVVDAVSWGANVRHSQIAAPSPESSINRASPDGSAFLSAPNPGVLIEEPVVQPAFEPTYSFEQSSPQMWEVERQVLAQEPNPMVPDDPVVRLPQVRITEIMSAPNPGEPEWIEIENFGNTNTALEGWILEDSQSSTELSGLLAPGERMIIATGEIAAGSDQTRVLTVRRLGNGLNNAGETLTLRDASGVAVDSVTYGSGSSEVPSPARGYTLALQPARWVVNEVPSPGGRDVQPFLEHAFSPASAQARAEPEGVPVIEASALQSGGLNPWLIVSAGLGGVIVVLLLLRWRPAPNLETAPEPEAPPTFSEPTLQGDVTAQLEEEADP